MKRLKETVLLLLILVILLCSCSKSLTTQWQEEYDLGVRYLSEGNYEEAVISFTAAIEIAPLLVDGYLMLSEAHIEMGNAEQAAETLFLGWQNCPDDSQLIIDRLEQIGYYINENGELISFQELETSAISAYREIQDTIYYGLSSQWQNIEYNSIGEANLDISYLWYRFPGQTLSNSGYLINDLNGDHIPELIISTADAMESGYAVGMIYDLYTYQDGQVVHLISSGERDRYYLCEDSVIANEGSAGAADSMYCYYELSGNTDELSLIEQVRYYGIETPDTPWYYGTTNTIDISEMVQIAEAEATSIIEQYTHIPLDLTLFTDYSP